MTFNVCIIGCGAMGRQHAAGWRAREDSQVMAVYDPIAERMEALASETGARAFSSYEDAILADGVNVVSICAPVCYHSEVACLAAQHGRHVLCEKPLALTLDQADAMITAARDNGVLLSTSFQYRGWSRILRYRELFQNGAFGGPIFARFSDVREVRPKLAMHRRSMNGGPIIDMAGHYFDLMRFITGKEPVSVFAQGLLFGRGKERLAGIDDLAIDAADILVTMDDGHVLSTFLNWGMPEGFKAFSEEMLVGPELCARLVGGQVEITGKDGIETCPANEGNPSGSTVRINDLAEAIKEGRQPEVTGEDGRIALQVSLAVLESIETGSVVNMSPLDAAGRMEVHADGS